MRTYEKEKWGRYIKRKKMRINWEPVRFPIEYLRGEEQGVGKNTGESTGKSVKSVLLLI